MSGNKGFTLIEVMVVVVIVGIISAIAYPSYIDFLIKGGRSDAHTALMKVANLQEQYYLDHRTYTDDLADLGLSTTTENNQYDLETTGGGSFTATATPKGSQATRDTECPTITISDSGVKGPKKECW
ncbi:type IV pilin protein [Shewanella sp. 3B26]|uniref:Type IV pilin protein n=1 Tax=Shewanella zhuhaiensis TaxID=2919576 RepID=A0AAJ1BEM9_9GAMM|nr:type IV pilin protein [Shewanella zhuhaiensis]MCH4293322.1 type IV pilin protein [Shewanella zhuhaiensis]